MPDLPELPPEAFAKQDASPDLDFYAPPRLVHHIDDAAVAALTAYYRELIPPEADVLDLMSSWVSHLPEDLPLGTVVGHGMNAEELAANPRLTRRFVRDLNVDPTLPLEDASFDAALCCVGAQYLQRPVEVFAEVARVLRPGAPFAVSYSNRCFPTKAVAIWRALDMGGPSAADRSLLRTRGVRRDGDAGAGGREPRRPAGRGHRPHERPGRRRLIQINMKCWETAATRRVCQFMARFYLHVHNRIGSVCDEEGQDLPDLDAAKEVAVMSIRSIISEEAQHGTLDLVGRVEIADADGRVVAVLPFQEAFELKLENAA